MSDPLCVSSLLPLSLACLCLTLAGCAGVSAAAAALPAAAAPTAPAGPTAPAAPPPPSDRLFSSPAAAWLYTPPQGTGLALGAVTASTPFSLNTHDGGFDYPVQYSDGGDGCTPFTDTLYYDLRDSYCVPVPAGGFAPSVGGWGANDGHLIVIDTSANRYYDFWKLLVDANGVPLATNVGQIVSGSLATGDGAPGATGAALTGLAGDILPGELDCEGCLQHALSMIAPSSLVSTAVCRQAPAGKTDGAVPGAVLCEGAKLQFDPAVNVDALAASTAVKALMIALQQYGGVITDQTSGAEFGIYSSLAHAPDLTGINLIGAHLFVYY